MNIVPIFVSIILTLNVLLALAIIFLERRDASATWAWLMVLLFIPVAGFFLYLIFGRRLSNKEIFTWDKKSRLGLLAAVQEQLTAIKENELKVQHEEIIPYEDLIYMHLKNNDALLSQNNEVEIFTDGQKKFHALIEDLEKAEDHIHLLYYILRDDNLGQRLANVLQKKAKEGVEVKLLYDDMGSRLLHRSFKRGLKEAGVQVESFFPSLIPKVNMKINYRNHRKLAIIDGEIGYIGGFNIGDEYLGFNKRFGYWRDTHLRVEGEAVNNMQTRFILDWNHASRRDIVYKERYFCAKPKGDVAMQIVSSGPDSEWEQIKHGYLKMILSAKEYVYIQTPYFIPDDSLLDALRVAVLSGVDVRIMIPNKPDHPFVYWATFSNIGDMLKAGAKIYVYQKGFLHAKTIVVDGKIASVGTANIDVRSFRLNFEVNAFVYHPEVGQSLSDRFHEDIVESTELTYKLYQARSKWVRFKEAISRLLSPIL
ncbi:cardiolipin synthase [Halobacillus karajensis]|uniref:Cardiolipin synthase n=1 Tax=Halobacillus karajensis TaxID=195088 RepID=A0A024P3I2_9BACI|nr:cardiolipin synthase [Halobacillus karajensis]CDQ18719.1 Major cardiolipin synthase ClsA [Halobacillus karajensis]CDQ23209.1 Major cardiolipin synthase ClsA [Halobacillus karajensis]CDQ26691.1 Major cardiolipin synthase ClsA [Halobacillus karajensis]SEH47582.1 cardiolipin synthase [Halobacillus karajensis]